MAFISFRLPHAAVRQNRRAMLDRLQAIAGVRSIAQVDPDRRAMVIADGTRELTLTIAVDADIHAGARALSPQALRQEVGRPVKVRYTNGTAGRVVDMVEVVPTDPA